MFLFFQGGAKELPKVDSKISILQTGADFMKLATAVIIVHTNKS
jgi:hypothetical protein